ncbi:MAG: hypothetical protein ACKVZJ_07985 [Phycisphaerales bacterium]
MPQPTRILTSSIALAGVSVCSLAPAARAGVVPTCTPVWAQLNPATSPSPRFSPAMATNGNDVVMFGGLGQGGITGDLWRWDGTNWSLITSNSALARSNAAAITLIPPGGGLPTLLIYGGVNPAFLPLRDLLTWSPATGLITLTADMGIGARFNHSWCGAIDQNFHNLLIGGGDCGGTFATGTRVTLGGNIAVPPPDSPANFYRRSNHASAWDSVRGRAVVIGGNIAANPCFSPTYDQTVRTWSPVDGWDSLPGVPGFLTSNHVAAFSPQDAMVVFGGETQAYPLPNGLLNTTWISRDGGAFWEPLLTGLTPSARRAFNNMAWVPAADHFVMFGGHNGGLTNGGFLGDTWVLSFRPVVLTAPVSLAACPTQTAIFTTEMALPTPSTATWSFRWIDVSTGFDSGWIDPPEAQNCGVPFNLVINGRQVALVENVCEESMRVRRLADFAIADRLLVRRTATSPCSGAVVIGAEAEYTLLPDLNNDFNVNTADLITFLGQFGQTGPTTGPYNPGDFNGDGSVNTADLIFFLGRFGRSCD